MNLIRNIRIVFLLIAIFFQSGSLFAQEKSGKEISMIGKIKPRLAREIQSSRISIGAEMMDRDYTIYANWREYLGPLGVKKARIQSGWAKCEKEKGVYDWRWLDEIIFDMVDQGVEPWVDLCYGNTVYPGGGGTTLQQKALPDSEEALTGWENYVKAIVQRYGQYVDEWEIWNEPNYGINTTKYASLVARTAKAIKSVQPGATVIGLALGSGVDYKYADGVLSELQKINAVSLIDQIAHHRHIVAPEKNEPEIELEKVIDKYSDKITTRQGEAGCPSKLCQAFALKDIEWSEIQQAKHILRRVMCDLGRGKETSIFTIIDARYMIDGKPEWNYKGLLGSDEDLKVSTIKPAYYATQHVTSIFDCSLEPVRSFAWEASDDENLYVFAHENRYSGKMAVALWQGNQKPTDEGKKQPVDIKIYKGNFTKPVCVDLRTGDVYEISSKNWSRQGTVYSFKNIPVYDSPVLIIDKSLISLKEN